MHPQPPCQLWALNSLGSSSCFFRCLWPTGTQRLQGSADLPQGPKLPRGGPSLVPCGRQLEEGSSPLHCSLPRCMPTKGRECGSAADISIQGKIHSGNVLLGQAGNVRTAPPLLSQAQLLMCQPFLIPRNSQLSGKA